MTPKEQYEARRKEKRDMKECCANCKFHQINPADMSNVLCRRYPPTIFLIPQGPGKIGQMAQYPQLPTKWWCGEYENIYNNILPNAQDNIIKMPEA